MYGEFKGGQSKAQMNVVELVDGAHGSGMMLPSLEADARLLVTLLFFVLPMRATISATDKEMTQGYVRLTLRTGGLGTISSTLATQYSS